MKTQNNPPSKWRIFCVCLTIVFQIQYSHSEDLPFPPVHDKICVPETGGAQKIVDKAKIALYLLKKYPFNAAFLDVAKLAKDKDISSQILSDPNLCTNKDACTDEDKSNLSKARGNMAGVLTGLIPGYKVTKLGIGTSEYFKGSDEDNKIVCEYDNSGNAIEAPGAVFNPPPTSPSVLSGLRIRGKIDDLYIDRSQAKQFQSSSQAVISFAQDNVNNKQTETFQGVVGYRVATDLIDKNNWQRLDIIPYAQVNRLFVTNGTGKSEKTTANEVIDFGATANIFLVSKIGQNPFGHVINVRPDYMFNLQDNSSLFSINLQYIPTLNSYLNDYRRIAPSVDNFFSYKLILDIRTDFGVYTDRGNSLVAALNKSYYRLGGQGGLAIVSDNKNIPISLVTSYTGLYGAMGGINIGYFANVITVYLDTDKYFGLSAGYTVGNREDTGKNEQLWNAGLSARY